MLVSNSNAEIFLSPEEKEQIVWDDWVFHSHKWVESHSGYYQCAFCGATHTSNFPINSQRLCLKNPFIESIKNQQQ